MNLLELAKKSKNVNQFIRGIQNNFDLLLNELYTWEHSTKEKQIKYKYIGWFGIAADYWEENKLN